MNSTMAILKMYSATLFQVNPESPKAGISFDIMQGRLLYLVAQVKSGMLIVYNNQVGEENNEQ